MRYVILRKWKDAFGGKCSRKVGERKTKAAAERLAEKLNRTKDDPRHVGTDVEFVILEKGD